MPRRDPLLGLSPTPSQKATVKYFFVVAALWVVQVALGAIVAHYGVEGGGFYGIPLVEVVAIFRGAHLASADRHLLDCNFMACDRTLYRSRGKRYRTEGTAAWA